jgi:diguanylate cyclase (GGDEF)-like protein/PAS domain S-box-containing protein
MWLPAWFSELQAWAIPLRGASRAFSAVICAARAGIVLPGPFSHASAVLHSAVLTLPALSPGKKKRRGDPNDAHELPESQPHFQALIEHSMDGTALLNPDGTVLYASPSTSRVVGGAVGSLVGKTIYDLLHPEDVRQAMESFEEVLEAPGNSRTTEMRCLRPGGAWAWIESTTTNLMDNPNVRAVIATFRDIDNRKRAEDKWRSLAVTDPLTGLKNYRGLVEAFEYELQRSSRTQRPFAVLLMDMDGLKKINDTLGHLVGNRAICRVAEAMKDNCRGLDTAARYGGDEFAMVLPESDTQSAEITAGRIERRLAEGEEQPPLKVSVGITSYPADGETAEVLLNTADEKLYVQKSARKSSLALR